MPEHITFRVFLHGVPGLGGATIEADYPVDARTLRVGITPEDAPAFDRLATSPEEAERLKIREARNELARRIARALGPALVGQIEEALERAAPPDGRPE